jgi:predicted RNA-binding Zn-ribbon protein involved in translation (DUF1610 family)
MSEVVHFRCPGCGSDLETPEGTVSNRCKFCGLTSLLGRPGRIVKRYYQPVCDGMEARFVADRHLKKTGVPLFSDVASVVLHYVPFYRFRGLSLSCLACVRPGVSVTGFRPGQDVKTYELRARNMDVTVSGSLDHPFGMASLGVRPQAIPTWAYRDDELPEEAFIWPVDRKSDETQAQAFKMNEAHVAMIHADKQPEFDEMVGERQALIYFPVYLIEGTSGVGQRQVVIDGLSKRVIQETTEPWQAPGSSTQVASVSELKPEPHKCPHCGADLPPSERSLVYGCENCDRTWLLDDAGFKQIDQPLIGEGAGELYPFWRVPLSFDLHPRCDTVGAFSRFLTADVPLLNKRKRHLPFYVYVPAFEGADAEWQVQSAVRMIRTQPMVEPERKKPREAASVSLPEVEAREFARFAWNWLRMSYLNMRNDQFHWSKAQTGVAELAWLPFTCDRLKRSVMRARGESVSHVEY